MLEIENPFGPTKIKNGFRKAIGDTLTSAKKRNLLVCPNANNILIPLLVFLISKSTLSSASSTKRSPAQLILLQTEQ